MYFDRRGGDEGVSVGLGCRRGGSHSKATAVVYISVLISPEKRQTVCRLTVNLTHLSVDIFYKFFSVELLARLWNDGVCREFELACR